MRKSSYKHKVYFIIIIYYIRNSNEKYKKVDVKKSTQYIKMKNTNSM